MWKVLAALTLTLALWIPTSRAASAVEEAETQLRTGRYDEAIAAAREALESKSPGEAWHRVLLEGLLTTGQYPEALAAWTNAVAQEGRSVRLRWLGREVLLANGDTEGATAQLNTIAQLVGNRAGNYRDIPSLVVYGQAALLSGADPKIVLDRVFDVARKAAPSSREVLLASGNLALEKHDFALAAKRFDEGLKQSTNDPDLHFGRARAFAPSQRDQSALSLEAALRINPRHIPSLLLMADQRIDAEDYDGAQELLGAVSKTNPHHPEAAAYEAVIAHLRNQPTAETEALKRGLRFWTNNPLVPHRIGAKLSQKYRFAEGAALQREALRFDPDFLPAKAQLANDLLRLGDEDEGWRLAQEVHKRDAYDVTQFNLVTLHDTLATYTSLTNGHFIVRMQSREASLYGPRVLALLERARTNLVPKYGATLAEPTLVEIFAQSKDFGVRTFGMPDNPGYLGVCFGRVVTANSPATNPGGTVNWEAVLWHEFCHVVTLQRTRNKMPRWLSEGISVYEERQADPSWGEHLTPKYREMLLGADLTPIARLSAAFLMPKSPLHLQFAYYESSLVVEYLVERFGIDRLREILGDLHDGQFILESLERRTIPVADLEKEFATFARKKAESMAPSLDWQKPEFARKGGLGPGGEGDFEVEMGPWAEAHPTNYWALDHRIQTLLKAKRWAEAKEPLGILIERFPNQTGAGSARERLARVHRELGETNAEWGLLLEVVRREAAAPEACQRLMQLASEREDWAALRLAAERYLAVNPLVEIPYRPLAESAEKTGSIPEAVAAYETLLKLDPLRPGELHYQIARLTQATDRDRARRHLLRALEDTPRHRDALALLLTVSGPGTPSPAPQ